MKTAAAPSVLPDPRWDRLWQRATALRDELSPRLMPWAFDAAPLFIAAGLERVSVQADSRWPYVGLWELPMAEKSRCARVGLSVSPVLDEDSAQRDRLALEWQLWAGEAGASTAYADLVGVAPVDTVRVEGTVDVWRLADSMLQVEPGALLAWCVRQLDATAQPHRIRLA